MPSVSLIAPNLNEEKNLPVFLNSLVDQTFKDFEVIIIDGFSTDKSTEIIESFMDRLDIKLIFCDKKNFGYIRNLGERHAKGLVTLQSNTDTYFEPTFFERLNREYLGDKNVISVTGRVYPLGTSMVARFAYPLFDVLRWFFASLPSACRKYRPSGSFISYRSWVWQRVNWFPEVTVNEDGLMGQRIDGLKGKVVFRLDLAVGHRVKKFEEWGGIRALMFYLYVLGNHFPLLKPLLKPIETRAGDTFARRV